MVVIGTAYGGWLGLQALGARSRSYAEVDAASIELPAELDVRIERLPRVPQIDEAAFGGAATLVRPMASISVRLAGPIDGDDLELAVIDGRSGAEIARVPATPHVELHPVPAGAHWLTLVPRGLSARRAYLSRTPVETVAGRQAIRELPAAAGSLRLSLGAGVKPPIVELVRPDDPEWRAEEHAQSTARSDGALQVLFPRLGHGHYLLYVHGLEPRPLPIPVTVDGEIELNLDG